MGSESSSPATGCCRTPCSPVKPEHSPTCPRKRSPSRSLPLSTRPLLTQPRAITRTAPTSSGEESERRSFPTTPHRCHPGSSPSASRSAAAREESPVWDEARLLLVADNARVADGIVPTQRRLRDGRPKPEKSSDGGARAENRAGGDQRRLGPGGLRRRDDDRARYLPRGHGPDRHPEEPVLRVHPEQLPDLGRRDQLGLDPPDRRGR